MVQLGTGSSVLEVVVLSSLQRLELQMQEQRVPIIPLCFHLGKPLHGNDILLFQIGGDGVDIVLKGLKLHFLRRRLQNTGSSLQIKTVRGIGYTLQ